MSVDLVALDLTDSTRPRLRAALDIYHDGVIEEARSPTDQLEYWIQHSPDVLQDEFRCYSIHRDAAVIGFLQYTYFRAEKILFFDFLCIKDIKRTGLLYSKDVFERIKECFTSLYGEESKVVFEIAHMRASKGSWRRDTKVINYFKKANFREVSYSYQYPSLQIDSEPRSYPAVLMVGLPNANQHLTASDLRTMLRALYFKHYLRWGRPFLSVAQYDAREKYINELYIVQSAAISGQTELQTIGYREPVSINVHLKRIWSYLLTVVLSIFGEDYLRGYLRLSLIAVSLLGIRTYLQNDYLFWPFVLASIFVYAVIQNPPPRIRDLVALISRSMKLRGPS